MCFLGVPRAHFDQQKAAAGRKQVEIVDGEVFAAHEVDQQVVEAFEADGLVLECQRHGVGGEKGIGNASTVSTRKGGLAVRLSVAETIVGAGAFGADQRAGDVEAVLGQQLVEVVAGDAARNARKFFADEVGVAVAQAGQAGIDLADAAAGANGGVELGGAGAAHRHARAVVENDVERFDVVGDLAAQQAVHAATVVADHAAEGAARVGGGIGRVGEVVQLGGFAQAVENDARLNDGQLRFRDRWSRGRSCTAKNRRPRLRWRTGRPGWCPRRAAARRPRWRGRRPERLRRRPHRAAG